VYEVGRKELTQPAKFMLILDQLTNNTDKLASFSINCRKTNMSFSLPPICRMAISLN